MNLYRDKVIPFIKQNRTNNPLLNVFYFGTHFELKELGRILNPREILVYITACKLKTNARVLVVVTDKRLIILNKGIIMNKLQVSIFLDQITFVQKYRKFYTGIVEITLDGGDRPVLLTGFWGSDTDVFVEALEEARYHFKTNRR